ncbi:MAG: hypothetical protein GWO11_09270 [Desulfuromonadales bacterium]|nr:hypothetical protein [Desulfuromonadales bacterium]
MCIAAISFVAKPETGKATLVDRVIAEPKKHDARRGRLSRNLEAAAKPWSCFLG